MSANVTRYEPWWFNEMMRPAPDGPWIKYSDFTRLLTENAALRAERDALKAEVAFLKQLADPPRRTPTYFCGECGTMTNVRNHCGLEQP